MFPPTQQNTLVSLERSDKQAMGRDDEEDATYG